MPLLTQPAFGPKLSIGFITGGALLDVWMLVWRATLARSPLTAEGSFWFWGLLLTGLTLILIGAFLGSIGRAARRAELPPDEATPAEANIQTTAAAQPDVVAPATAAPVASPAGGTQPGAIPAQPAVASTNGIKY